MVSTGVFAGVLAVLIVMDDRVRDRVGDLVSGADGLGPLEARFGELGSALLAAIRHQSIENSPLLLFAFVGAVLVLFMVRT
jgi:uncharacterized membrane protein YeaQ/YmgE (transglycosylase-associated protein family)